MDVNSVSESEVCVPGQITRRLDGVFFICRSSALHKTNIEPVYRMRWRLVAPGSEALRPLWKGARLRTSRHGDDSNDGSELRLEMASQGFLRCIYVLSSMYVNDVCVSRKSASQMILEDPRQCPSREKWVSGLPTRVKIQVRLP